MNHNEHNQTMTHHSEYFKITNEDNMDLMSRYGDNHFDLAVVDPPYGINVNMNAGRKKTTRSKKREVKKWDKKPKTEYFSELFRVSKNQIIWGGNYFKELPIISSWIFWDKCMASDCSFSDGELAWTSFGGALKKVVCPWSGFIGSDGKRTHPTQKPSRLYEWLLTNYSKKGDKILDTHLGSGSIAIASHNTKRHLTACEIDSDYYNQSLKTIHEKTRQLRIF